MRVVTFNVNGVRSASAKGLMAWVADHGADLVCLQEVRALEHQLPPELRLLSSYRACWNLAGRKGYSGVGILSHKEPLRTACGVGDATFDAEGRVLRAEFAALTVLSVYVPSGITGPERQAHKMQFLARFLTHLTELKEQGRELLVCGDFNIAHRPVDVANPERNQFVSGFRPEERAFFDALLARGFVDTFRALVGPDAVHYTWWPAWARKTNRGWRLDYQIATPGLAAKAHSPRIDEHALFSDHTPLSIDYDVEL